MSLFDFPLEDAATMRMSARCADFYGAAETAASHRAVADGLEAGVFQLGDLGLRFYESPSGGWVRRHRRAVGWLRERVPYKCRACYGAVCGVPV